MNTLVIDTGTSSMKFVLFGEDSTCLWKDSTAYHVQGDGLKIEIDASLVIEGMHKLLVSLGKWCEKTKTCIDVISLTSQRSSVLPVNDLGEPLCKVMLWQDCRADSICMEQEGNKKIIHAICGMVPTPVYSAPKIAWIKEHEPALYTAAYKLIGFYELLIFQLTGQWATDETIASRSGLFSLHTGDWSSELLEFYAIDRHKLCELYPIGFAGFSLRPELQQLLHQVNPITCILGGGDQQCAAAGAGCIHPGDIQINTGTGGYVLGIIPPHIARDVLSLNYNCSVIAPYLLVESSSKYCGSALERIFSLCYTEKDGWKIFDEHATYAQSDCGGCSIRPNLIGDRRFYSDIQLVDQWGKWISKFGENNVCRSVLKGIAMDLVSCVQKVTQACPTKKIESIICGGGLTNSNIFCQVLADALQLQLLVPIQREITALGALLVARRTFHKDWERKDQKYTIFFPCQ